MLLCETMLSTHHDCAKDHIVGRCTILTSYTIFASNIQQISQLFKVRRSTYTRQSMLVCMSFLR